MASTLRAQTGDAPRKMLAMKGERVRKEFADGQSDIEMGRLIARAFQLANLTPKEVAFHLGYTDQSAISRWVSGAEPVRLSRLWAFKALRAGLVLAFAEATEQDVEIRTVVTVSRRKEGAA